jgi:hypothetical protein
MSRLVFVGAAGLFLACGLITFFWSNSGSRSIVPEARAAIQAMLRDPSSAQFQDEVVFGSGNSRTVCGNVNAKNGFGGYAGKAAFIYEEQSKMAKIASDSDEVVESCRQANLNALQAQLNAAKAALARRCEETPNDPACIRWQAERPRCYGTEDCKRHPDYVPYVPIGAAAK